MNARQKYRRFVCFLLILSVIGLGICGWAVVRESIPDVILVSDENELPVLFRNGFDSLISGKRVEADAAGDDGMQETTAVDLSGSTAFRQAMGAESKTADDGGIRADYAVSYSLLGKIPLKTVSVSVVPREKVYIGGTPIGIYLETDGVFVVETGKVINCAGEECSPAENIVKSGDYIQAVNGEDVSTKEELIACISRCDGEDLILDVQRSGEQIRLRVQPVQDENGTYKAGIWVRNDTQGIGTLTYVDESAHFGALGHGISDVDTGALLDIRGGTLYDADVISVIKGKQGTPGELSGVIHYSEGYKIGEITENRQNGIYGTIVGLPDIAQEMELYETAYKQEIEQGAATILCSVDGTCRQYEVEIREIRLGGSDVNKGMVLEVTDPELLELTGGIVQGM